MAKTWNLEPSQVIFVGDTGDDLKCGSAAGMKTVLFDPETKRPHLHATASIVVKSFEELKLLLLQGVPM